MNYIFYLDKNLAKKGITCVKEKFIEEPKNFIQNENLIKYIGSDIPHYIKYYETNNNIVESSFEEHIQLGFKHLEKGQVIINGKLEIYNPNFEYIENNIIKTKTREMLVLEGIEKPFNNEYIKDGKLKIIPKKPKDMIKGEFDFLIEKWIEKASLEDKRQYWLNKCLEVSKKIEEYKMLGFEGRQELVDLENKLQEYKLKYSATFESEAIAMDKHMSSTKPVK